MNMYEIERYVNVGLRKGKELFSKEQKDVTSAATSSAGGIIDVKKYLDVIGYPPENLIPDTNKVIRNSMPVAAITPCSMSGGLTTGFVLDVEKGLSEYKEYLNHLNFEYTPPVKIAFLADTFPTDSFNNEYSQSLLSRIGDTASTGFGEIAQLLGKRDAGAQEMTTAINKLIERAGGAGAEREGTMIGKALSGLHGGAMEAKESISKVMHVPGAKAATDIGLSMLAGGRVDFPQIWKGSSYSPSYSLTVRLYNPHPADPESTRKYIIGPLAVLLTMGMPISKDSYTYNWPLLIKVDCPGIFKLESGFLSSIAVVKGGDQQQISHNQRLSIVDVRLEIGSLYSSILTSNAAIERDRPTLEKYLDNLGHVDENIKKTENYNASSGKATGLLGLAETYLGDLADIPGRFYEGIKTGNVDLLTPPMSRVSNANNSAFTNLKGAGRGMEFF